MIFDKPEFSPDQPQVLIKDHSISLWTEYCGFNMMNFQKHYELMLNKYNQQKSEQMVGIADVKVESFVKLMIITALPCMRLEATPLIVKSWQKIRPPIQSPSSSSSK